MKQEQDNMDNIARAVSIAVTEEKELYQVIFVCGDVTYRINLLPSVFEQLKERVNNL